MVQTKKRNSSIELLRIIAMIDIVMFHYLSRNCNLYAVENSRIAEDVNLWKEMIFQYIGYLGVPCFMFISGYYGIKFKWGRFGGNCGAMFLLWYSFFRRTLVDKWKSSTIL